MDSRKKIFENISCVCIIAEYYKFFIEAGRIVFKIKNKKSNRRKISSFILIFYLIFIVGTVLELLTNYVTFLKIVGRFKKIFGTRMLARLFDGFK